MRAIVFGIVCAVAACYAAATEAQGGDQQVGSVLMYNYYLSGASSGNTTNTRFGMTNTDATTTVHVRLFFVNSNGMVIQTFFSLQPRRTTAFLASDVDPGQVGYVLAVAVAANGCPISHNALIGDSYAKQSSGHEGNLGAIAFKALFSGTLLGCTGASTSATLNFDGVSYERAPRVLALDKIPSRADGNDTLVVFNRFGGDLTTSIGAIGMANGQLFDAPGNQYDFTFNATGAQFRSSLSNGFPVTVPNFETVIPAGRTGWMKVFANSDVAMTGAMFNFNPNAGAAAGAFTGGHSLRALSLTAASSYMIAVNPIP